MLKKRGSRCGWWAPRRSRASQWRRARSRSSRTSLRARRGAGAGGGGRAGGGREAGGGRKAGGEVTGDEPRAIPLSVAGPHPPAPSPKNWARGSRQRHQVSAPLPELGEGLGVRAKGMRLRQIETSETLGGDGCLIGKGCGEGGGRMERRNLWRAIGLAGRGRAVGAGGSAGRLGGGEGDLYRRSSAGLPSRAGHYRARLFAGR